VERTSRARLRRPPAPQAAPTTSLADRTTQLPAGVVQGGLAWLGGGKRGGYKAAAQEYEQQGLLDYSMEEEGEGVVGEEEEDENLLEEEDLEVMDREPVGTDRKAGEVTQDAAAGDRQVGENSVFITQEELMDKEMRRLAREERRKQAAEAKLARIESAREAKQLGRELAGKAKIDHRYYAVRSLRASRPAGRELNRRAEGGAVKVLEDGFLSGGDERWLRNYNIHNLESQVNVSCSFNPRTGFCYMCCGEPHRAMQ
jgi:hypothetical protein